MRLQYYLNCSNGAVTRALLRRNPVLDLVRIQDLGLSGITDPDLLEWAAKERRVTLSHDPDLLEWAAKERRVTLSHDVSTLRKFAEDRVRVGLPMPGVFEIGENVAIRDAIEDLLLIAECSREGEWEGQVRFLPLR